jgi:hypothetical protein
MHHRYRTLSLWPLLAAAGLPFAAHAAKLNVLGSQSGTVNASLDLATVKYDVTGKRVVATTLAGNFACPQGSAPGAGQVGLTIDGNTYGLAADPAGAQATPVDYAPGSKEFTLQVAGSELCKSSNTTTAGLKLFLDEQGAFTVAESAFYRTATRTLDVRIADPVLCYSYAAPGSGVTLHLTDASNASVDLPGFKGINYLLPTTAAVHANSTIDSTTGGRPVQCYGFPGSAQSQAALASANADHIFGAAFEYVDLQADLVVDTSTSQANVLADNTARGIHYTVTVANAGNGAASDVRLGEYVPAVQGATIGRGGWTCTRFATLQAVTGTPCGSGAAGTAFAPAGLTIGAGEVLEFEVDRTITSASVGTAFTFGIAAFVAPAPSGDNRPDRNYANNSDPVTFQLVGNQPPAASPPLAQSTAEDGTPVTLVYSPTDAENNPVTMTQVTSSDPLLFTAPLTPVAGPAAGQWSVVLTPAANRNGSATITATFSDGTTSSTVQSSVTVTPVNDAPDFTLSSAALTVPACSPGPTCDYIVNDFVSALSPGPSDEAGQALELVASGTGRITCSSVPAGFFGSASAPQVFATGATYRLVAEGIGAASGTATCEIIVRETADTTSAKVKPFTITYP